MTKEELLDLRMRELKDAWEVIEIWMANLNAAKKSVRLAWSVLGIGRPMREFLDAKNVQTIAEINLDAADTSFKEAVNLKNQAVQAMSEAELITFLEKRGRNDQR